MARVKLEEIVIVVIFALAMLQGVSLLLTQIFGIPVLKVGVVFQLLAVAGAVLVGFGMAARLFKKEPIGKPGALMILLVAGLVLFMYLLLPNLVPQIFSVSNVDLQSIFMIN